MKNALLVMLIFLFSQSVNAQQEFKSGFLFKNSKLKCRGTLFLVGDTSKVVPDTIGSFILSSNLTYIIKQNKINEVTYDTIKISNKLKGIVTERNQDTLFIKFWDIKTKTDLYKDSTKYVNCMHNGKDFIYVIKSTRWRSRCLNIYKRKYCSAEFYNIPFRFRQFTATSLPFRVLTKTGNLESDFLNANVAYLFFSGRTKIYKSEFVKPRSCYFGWGFYGGLSSIDNVVTSKKEFGLNYGVNIVEAFQGLNLTFAYGFQNGFNEGTKEIQPYFGFGIGFKLVETFTPEIKNKGE